MRAPRSSSVCGATRPSACWDLSLLRPERREQDDVADVVDVGEEHQHPVDPDAETSRRWQAIFQGAQVVVVDGHRLVVSGRTLTCLVLEPGALLVGVDELAEGVADLASRDDRLEALDETGKLAVVARER